MDIGIKHTEHLLLTDPGHILRSSGKYPSTHRGVAGTLESRFHPVPLQYSCMFMCIGGVDLAILLRETRSALIERMFSNLPVCANTLIEEHWRASICGPKNEVYHVFIVYSGKAAQSTTSDPRQPVGLDQAKGIPGIMSVVRRNDI
ncbi:hypothetical protein FA15DRAFT_591135 [Coprinopsis marcescibilis]|uniref:Uncharacterized protein n=1 Tax=Coprinopsis marcescibilis TaxID=230819 RepID=A0A5C3KZ58_COPMA|nr:hypothetical protein FA15DRAFT_591135 [Coprinopsis marcescibilis]